MSDSWIFIVGLALLFGLCVVIGRRLGPEYRSRLAPSVQTLALVWVFYATHFTLVVLAAVKSTWRFTLPIPVALGSGIGLMAVGGAIALSAAYAFRSITRMNGFNSTRLVTQGIYRWSRNPQLVGWTLVLVGLGLIRGSAMVLLLALVSWLSYMFALPLEEELLRRLFGEAYETYRHRTHRYFGRPGSAAGRNQGIRSTASGG